MRSRKMVTIINTVLIPVMVAVAVSAEPRWGGPVIPDRAVNEAAARPVDKAVASCLPLGKPCVKSNLPCCTLIYQKTYMGFGTVPATCFKFGKGVCQVNQSIQNFSEYSRLITQLNSTNFRELRNKYWSSIPTTLARPQEGVEHILRNAKFRDFGPPPRPRSRSLPISSTRKSQFAWWLPNPESVLRNMWMTPKVAKEINAV